MPIWKKTRGRDLYAQLRGARKLRRRGTPSFVVDACSTASEVPLGLKTEDFPRTLVGAHSSVAEFLLRQIFLQQFSVISTEIIKNVGSGQSLEFGLPPAWLDALEAQSIPCSRCLCAIRLFTRSILDWTIGVARFLVLSSQIGLPESTNSRYVVFLDLLPDNLPVLHVIESYDVILGTENLLCTEQGLAKSGPRLKLVTVSLPSGGPKMIY